MRMGYTTGSNAAGAAKAATLALLTGHWPEQVRVSLPDGKTTLMPPLERNLTDSTAFCCMRKDGGDDPDVTHGALICAQVRRTDTPGLVLEGGKGVGRVTLPGLGLEVGTAAINPVPRRQITANVADALAAALPHDPDYLARHGLEVVISVPEGERIAPKTLNPRLGIIGGISILGTSGRVSPYSTAAWRASVVQAVEMAAYHHVDRVVLATGSRSERYAMQLFPDLPEVAFVEMSIFTGAALKTCVVQGVRSVVLVAMISRIVKTAQGRMVTHVAGNPVDLAFLAQVCREAGAAAELVAAVAAANTARHALELCQQHGDLSLAHRLVALALAQVERLVRQSGGGPVLELEVVLVDFDGGVLARQRSISGDKR
ncbi:MAG: cobalt-precorrin-5B (C(1))-methyltransferase [Chloroflexaceae bacterium]|nr:cobalt-precorrin-5B (C(1))-methyltransferase [Chloroflexaceae bacterium]